jgi:DNA-binding beta-propeller fold protein YncE
LETEICTSTKGMPQDIRISPDGKRFFVADMDADGVHVLDGDAFVEVGFIPTGLGAHGLYPSRDGKRLYVANRGTHKVHGSKKGPGKVSVIDSHPDRRGAMARSRGRQPRHGQRQRGRQVAVAVGSV